jgi:hypothetical protein
MPPSVQRPNASSAHPKVARVRVGVEIPMAEGEGGGSRSSSIPDWPTIQAFAWAAEERGLDSLWLCDHFFRFPTEPTGGIHEAWTIVAALPRTDRSLERLAKAIRLRRTP